MGCTLTNGTDTIGAFPVVYDAYSFSLNYFKRVLPCYRVHPQGTSVLGALGTLPAPLNNGNIAAMSVNQALLKDYLTIRAPFTGVVAQRNIKPGTLVGTCITKPIRVAEDHSKLRLRLPVPEF